MYTVSSFGLLRVEPPEDRWVANRREGGLVV